MIRSRLKSKEDGMLLVSIFIITLVLAVIGLSLAAYAVSFFSVANRAPADTNARLIAEAGIEQSLYQLNEDSNFVGYSAEQEFFNDQSQGRATFVSEITDAEDGNAKYIISRAKVYKYNQNSDPVSAHSVKVTVVGTSSEGYSVHSGPGGLILSGSANITNADVFVNGTIQMTGAARIGTASKPLNVDVAHKACPAGNNPGPTYPQVCSSGQPISLEWSTFIYGTVCATNQTSTGPNPSGNILPGTGGQGLVGGCVAPPVNTPEYNRAGQIAAVTTTGAGNNNSYVCASWPFDRTWPAKLRLTGNVSVDGSCNVVIRGDTYITGNLTIGGAARITVDESVGSTRPVVMVDGNINVGGSAQIISNSHGIGIHFISFKSSAACNPNCATVTGTDLKNSQNLTTVDVGGAVNLPGMIFHAYWSKVRIAGSGNVGAAAGQTVDLSGAGTVVFGTKLSSGDRTWTISSYQRIFPD